jgi:hypothetical protein
VIWGVLASSLLAFIFGWLSAALFIGADLDRERRQRVRAEGKAARFEYDYQSLIAEIKGEQTTN